MAGTRKLTVVLAGDASGLQRALGSADKSAKGLGSKIAGLGKVAALGLGAAAVGAVALGRGFVDAAIESQKATKQTEAVIKSMGGASNVTAKQVADLSEKLSMKSGVDDELIQSGQNVLLTFGKVRNEAGKGNQIFDRATTSALDMSVALGTDLSAANIQLGKALNDPIKGITALGRAGVSFTADQKEQIKTMVESGDVLGAQKIILGEMEKQFGGSAAAQATAGEKLKVVWGNLQEELGAKLLPIVEKVAAFLAKNLPRAMEAVGRVVGPIAEKIGMFWNALTSGFTEDEGTRIEMIALKIRDGFQKLAAFITDKALPALKGIGEWILEHKPVLIGLAAAIGTGLVAAFVAWATAATAAAVATIAAHAPLIALGVAIGALVAGIIYAYENWGFFRTAVDKVASFFKNTLWPILQAVAGWITGTLIPTVARIASKFGEVVGFIRRNWQMILGILTGPIGAAVMIIARHRDSIVGFFQSIPGKIRGFFAGLATAISSPFRSAFTMVKNLWNRTAGGFGFSIPGWVPGVGGKEFRIPEMHTGGIFDSGRGEGLAMLRDGEGVFTPRQMAALGPGSSLQPVPVVIELDGQVLGRAMIRFDADHRSRNGRSAFGG